MPLTAALPTLITDIEAAFEAKRKVYNQDPGPPSEGEMAAADIKFYTDLATAIHKYTMQAQVFTVVNTGVVGIAGPLAPVGACPVGGTGVGVGNGNLL